MEINSNEQQGCPSQKLALAPPIGVHSDQVRSNGSRGLLLTWNRRDAAASYQICVRLNGLLQLVYQGANPRCLYLLPDDLQAAISQSNPEVELDFAFRCVKPGWPGWRIC